MKKPNNFKRLLVEEEIQKAIVAAEKFLLENYVEEDEEFEGMQEVWGSENRIEVPSVPYFFKELSEDGALPANLRVQYTVNDEDSRYADSDTRFIVFDELIPVLVIPCQEVIGADSRTRLEGLSKEGFEKIAEAMLVYEHLGATFLQGEE